MLLKSHLITSNKKIIDIVECIFKYIFFAYIVLGFCNLTYGHTIISYFMYVSFICGGVLILIRCIHWKYYVGMPMILFPVLFLISYLVSTLFNISLFSKKTVIYFILFSIYFFLLYTQPNYRSRSDLIKELRWFCIVFLGLTLLLVIISFYMLMTGYWAVYRDPNNDNYEIAVGFFSGRLWGAFQDPIHGSLMCCASIAIAYYYYQKTHKYITKFALICVIVLFTLYIALADSRNGMLCLGIVSGLMFCFSWFSSSKTQKKKVLGLAISIMLVFISIFVPVGIQKIYNSIVIDMTEDTSNDNPGQTAEDPSGTGENQKNYHIIDRGYDVTEDLSAFGNRRFQIWGSAIDIFKKSPVVGVTFPGIVPFAKQYLPNTYIISQPDYWIINTMESELFNTLAGQGFIGVMLLIIWTIGSYYIIFKNLKSVDNRYNSEISLLITIVTTFFVSAQFQGLMFYQTTPNTFLFWLAFGSLLSIVRANYLKSDADIIK